MHAKSQHLAVMYDYELQNFYGIIQNSHPDLQGDIQTLQTSYETVKKTIADYRQTKPSHTVNVDHPPTFSRRTNTELSFFTVFKEIWKKLFTTEPTEQAPRLEHDRIGVTYHPWVVS